MVPSFSGLLLLAFIVFLLNVLFVLFPSLHSLLFFTSFVWFHSTCSVVAGLVAKQQLQFESSLLRLCLQLDTPATVDTVDIVNVAAAGYCSGIL